ncbi:DUF2786 domain-containing protein [Streptomyces physcomitrii]|uniref:DUF2786 domain-containing protein n=1 Tax=Streptomyces physcomitrii TaxID=2724184 RepID=UPI0033F956B7
MNPHATVTRAFEAALGNDSEDALDTGASLLAAAPAADAELDRRGREFLTRSWRGGWQPADLARLVRRDLDGVHLVLLDRLTREETSGYEGLPHRWPEQLAELRAEAASAGSSPAPDRFSAATAALELYRFLGTLPRIEPVGPAPGEKLPPPVAGEPKMLARIRALLAKAEATPYPEEAEALSAKAQELMARQGVDEAVLAARRPAKDVPSACRIGVDAPYETAKAVLLDAVARANRCRAVWNSGYGFSTVVGFESDLEAVELLHTSLLVQATAAMTRAEAAQRKGGRKRTKSFRQSFLASYAHRIGDRLTAVSEQVASESGEFLPVLAAREVAVQGRTDELFPQTVSTRVRGVNDPAGWEEGAEAADRAALGPGRERIERGRPGR